MASSSTQDCYLNIEVVTTFTTPAFTGGNSLPISMVSENYYIVKVLFDSQEQADAYAAHQFCELTPKFQEVIDKIHLGEVVSQDMADVEDDPTIKEVVDARTPLRQFSCAVKLRVRETMEGGTQHVIKVLFNSEEHAASHEDDSYASLYPLLDKIIGGYYGDASETVVSLLPPVALTHKPLTFGDILDARTPSNPAVDRME